MKELIVLIALIIAETGVTSGQHKLGTNIGNKAPELIGKSTTGEMLKLSDTSGQLVLLDFWAAWCVPCRRENLILVQTWKKYRNKKFNKGKGFTVFSVSLDRTEEAWEKGIADDELDWPHHISDLKGWHSKYAAIYGIRSIPDNFLIDGNGIIIARKLRGPALEATLEKMVR